MTDLAELLNAMGGQVEGAGTQTVTIHGVPTLGGASHRTIPDRIETGTFAMAGAMTGGDVTIRGCRPGTSGGGPRQAGGNRRAGRGRGWGLAGESRAGGPKP